ncbi:hypothetical protein QVD17_30630 [Tagetes erecta]|uniref:Uncharacterized protein n=1 Tax=Tagetes erecta TaxID=13708 RepID=A0AAD8K2Z8_TARER|nr:hypothetical protein QVD17_30630 [Tagetes erecta]
MGVCVGKIRYVEKRCLRAKEIRMSQKNMHTAGPKSFARIRDKLRKEDPNNEVPSLTQLFEHTRKRTEGHTYLDTYDDTARKIEQMKNYKSPEDGSALVDPFTVALSNKMVALDLMQLRLMQPPIKGCIRPNATFSRTNATFYKGCIRLIFL